MNKTLKCARSLVAVIFGAAALLSAHAQATKEEVEAAKNAVDLRVYQEIQDLLVRQKEAEARKAIAEAEKAEAAAKIPPSETKLLTGSINTEKFGAASLVKAFDLARELAESLCTSLDPLKTVTIYDAAIVQGVVTARIVESEMARATKDLRSALIALESDSRANKQSTKAIPIAGLVGGVKAIADLASLFKTNVTAVGVPYGDSTRSMFITALAERCPSKIAGMGIGYLGELDVRRYERLRLDLTELFQARQAFSDGIGALKKRASKEKDEEKARLEELAATATTFLKQTDTLIDALKVSDFSDKGTLFNAARYLAYAERTRDAQVLDFDLRLEGLAITKETIFIGQRLSLSGVAFLWYRLHTAHGALVRAGTLRRITEPMKVDLHGTRAPSEFWTSK